MKRKLVHLARWLGAFLVVFALLLVQSYLGPHDDDAEGEVPVSDCGSSGPAFQMPASTPISVHAGA